MMIIWLISLGPGLLQSPDFSLPEMRRQSRATDFLLDAAERLGRRAIALDADALLPELMRHSIFIATFVERTGHLRQDFIIAERNETENM